MTTGATGTLPVIGITMDHETGGGYSRYPWYALRDNYMSPVVAAGGLPLPLPHYPELAGPLLDMLDGLLISGGAFDVSPGLYGAMERHPSVEVKEERTRCEMALLKGAMARELPVLGICGGMQLINVVLGGDLVQHIPVTFPDALAHEQPNPRHEPSHPVFLSPGTRLAAIYGGGTVAVNSAHHQAVGRVAPGLVVAARAPDGIIEAIEAPGDIFLAGVQWHPEFLLSQGDVALFRAFTGMAAGRRGRRQAAPPSRDGVSARPAHPAHPGRRRSADGKRSSPGS